MLGSLARICSVTVCELTSSQCARVGKIIVPKLDRFARNAEETLWELRELTAGGVVFQFGKTVYDPCDPFSKLFLIFLGRRS